MTLDAFTTSRRSVAVWGVAMGVVLLVTAVVASRVSFLYPLDCPDVGESCPVADRLSYPFTGLTWWLGSLGAFAMLAGLLLLWRYNPRRQTPRWHSRT